jgi:hypothetical protein
VGRISHRPTGCFVGGTRWLAAVAVPATFFASWRWQTSQRARRSHRAPRSQLRWRSGGVSAPPSPVARACRARRLRTVLGVSHRSPSQSTRRSPSAQICPRQTLQSILACATAILLMSCLCQSISCLCLCKVKEDVLLVSCLCQSCRHPTPGRVFMRCGARATARDVRCHEGAVLRARAGCLFPDLKPSKLN